MNKQDPVVRGGLLAIALMLGVVLAAAINAGYFRPKSPQDPESFHIVLEEAHQYPDPANVAVSININPTGNFTVTEAKACNEQPDLRRQEWIGTCKQQEIRQGSIYRQDVLTLRDTIRSRGFYRWHSSYKNSFGNNDAFRICIFEKYKRKCVLVQTSLYFAFKSGPKDFWGAREDVYRLTSTQIR